MIAFLHPMGCSAPSTIIVVDLNANAVDIACRLGSLVCFLEAVEELKTCSGLVSSEFRRHSRKIISLIEVARRTLTAAGISLHMFRSCSPTSAPFRTAYVELLKILKERRYDVEEILQERVKHLLQPLSSGFFIQRRGDPTLPPLLQMPTPSSTRGSHDRSHNLTSRPATVARMAASYTSLMPPPDAFPVVLTHKPIKKALSSLHRRLWDPEIFISPSPRRHVRSPDREQENEFPLSRFAQARPIPRRFGIFCTGKGSMPPQERVGRPRAPRSLAKD